MRRDRARGRVGTSEQHEKPGVGNRLKICLQTSDMMAAADGDGDNRMLDEPFARSSNRLAHQPRPRQITSIPRES